ncbi:MAG TPA: thiamine pyrophosphate-binding protein [Thermoleophilaceae bacterium]|nr:thiamine pyrophosphate-binding protein [Thermoleophilaceae bacterium]
MSSSAPEMLTGARLCVAALEQAGVEVVFGLPGVHNLALWRELGTSPIRLVGVRHEQTAAYAADGYARASGRVGVAATTTGPGAANTLGAVGEAWASRSPLLVIATDIPTRLRRPGVWRGVLHETTDQAAMFEPVTKATFRVSDPDELGSLTAEALATALAPPSRPVYLEVPTDLLAAAASAPAPGVSAEPAAPGAERPAATAVDAAALDEAAERLSRARSPLIWAGGGALQAAAGEALARLAERLAAPVILTFSGRGLLPPGHPCLADGPAHMPQIGGLWDEADVVLAVGSDLDGMSTQNWAQPQPQELVCVNVDRADAAKNYRADLVLEADARAACEALAERIEQRPGLDALGERLSALRVQMLEQLEREDPDGVAFLHAFTSALPDEATVVCDMCIPGYWFGAFGRVVAPRGLLYPLGWGTLGCAFPQALGAALAGPGPVVSLSGDGGFLYACGELAAAAQERIPLTAVVVDDGGYGMIRYDQDLHGDPHEGVDLRSPDFAALARSFGVHADAVDGLGEEFSAALRRQLALDEPSLLVASATLGPPPNVSPRWYRRG